MARSRRARFWQTVGGRTGLRAPRRVRRKPFVQWMPPLVWTTLSLTLHTVGDADSSALVMAVETALERSLSAQLMHGERKPRIDRLSAGTTVVRQGQPGIDIYLLLDGVMRVEQDGRRVAEYGPGAVLG